MSVTKYEAVLSRLFFNGYEDGCTRIEFTKDGLLKCCAAENIKVKNAPDILYTYRVRKDMPPPISKLGNWIIDGNGRGKYVFCKINNNPQFECEFDFDRVEVVKDLTPLKVRRFLRHDEQSLLSRISYSKLLDAFIGNECLHVQSHYRSFVKKRGEVEIDSLYREMGNRPTLIAIEAKSFSDSERVGRFQIAAMSRLLLQSFPKARRKMLAAKDLGNNMIGIIRFSSNEDPDKIRILSKKVYRLGR